MTNKLRTILRAGKPAIGSWIQFAHTGVAEIMAQAGFTWLGIDLEHSTIGIESVLPLVQVIELSGCAPLVRLPSNDPVLALRVMDAGAHGIIVPHVSSPEEAEQAVRSVRYPPHGTRGVGLGRAHGYGARFEEYVKESAEATVVVAMIEDRQGLERISEIAAVPGVDAIFIGPYDLSASLGIPGQLEHQSMKEAFAAVVNATRLAGIAAGIHVVHPPVDRVRDRLAEGFRFIAFGGDMLLLESSVRDAAAQLRVVCG